jgi:hypothetical protein
VTELREEVREGSPPGTIAPDANGQSAQRANSITQPSSIAFDAITQSARFLFRGGVSVLAAVDRAGSLGDAQPPTLRQARAELHRCAGHYQAAFVRWPRLAWGYVHLLIIKPALNGLEWVTFSPARLAVALAVVAAIWLGGLA